MYSMAPQRYTIIHTSTLNCISTATLLDNKRNLDIHPMAQPSHGLSITGPKSDNKSHPDTTTTSKISTLDMIKNRSLVTNGIRLRETVEANIKRLQNLSVPHPKRATAWKNEFRNLLPMVSRTEHQSLKIMVQTMDQSDESGMLLRSFLAGIRAARKQLQAVQEGSLDGGMEIWYPDDEYEMDRFAHMVLDLEKAVEAIYTHVMTEGRE